MESVTLMACRKVKNEKEIYLMSEKQDDDDKVTYQLQAGKIG